MELQENVALGPLTTMEVGGPARYFVDAASETEVREAINFAAQSELPLLVMGGGSNLIVSDRGWPGVVVRIRIEGFERYQRDHKVIFDAGAGEEWDSLVALAVAQDCAGLECLSGIPGTVGGAPIQNIGAYGQEVSQTISGVTVLDRSDGQVKELCPEACEFGYRSSVFNTSCRDRFVVLRATFALSPGGAPDISYGDVQRRFADRSAPATLAEVREAVRQIRASKAMLIQPGEEDSRSAGSFFKNPVLTGEDLQCLLLRAEERGEIVPTYPAEGESKKIPAAWLVEHSGFHKGCVRGRAAISHKHALAIVNRGGASADEILALQEEIRDGVYRTWGISLAPEPVFVGF
jgi:UDP-N-acetylmuramate dehydrogenase